VDHPLFGRTFHCICRRTEVLSREMGKTIQGDTIPVDSYSYELTDFENKPYAKQALAYLRSLLSTGVVHDNTADVQRYGVLLRGPTGCGKTTMAAIVYRTLMVEGKSMQWWNAAALVKRVQSTYSKDYSGPDYEQIINAVSRLEVLVLDDIGSPTRKEQYSEDHIEIILRVLNYRDANHLLTIGTSNCKDGQLLMQFGPRNFSRLNGMMAFTDMNGADFRLGSKAHNRPKLTEAV
jgi:DNA replication protein DnaC